jgi:predicted glycosyltransferase
VRPTVLFYCQHSVGIGHLTRSYVLTAALAKRFRVVLACGGTLPDAIAPPAGVELVRLPPVGVGAAARFVSHDPRYTLERAWAARSELLLETIRSLRPAAVLVELFPFGRAKFARELVPVLEETRRVGGIAACSLRDILVTGRPDQRAHDERACALANAHLDVVLMHSDPRVATLEHTFRPPSPLTVPVRYTGFVVNGSAARQRRRHGVVVSAGGGLVGEPLLQAAVAAHRLSWPSTGLPMRVIAGPLLPPAAWERLRAAADGQPGLELCRSVPDLSAELRAAAASISQCGYNTSLEVVRSRVPALVVPYATEEEDEQRRRARRLERLGVLRVLDPERLDPAALARELERLPAFQPARAAIDLDGARSTCRQLWDLVTAPRRRRRARTPPAPLVTESSPGMRRARRAERTAA